MIRRKENERNAVNLLNFALKYDGVNGVQTALESISPEIRDSLQVKVDKDKGFILESDRDIEDLTIEEQGVIKNRGYEILRTLGEGQTRTAYLTRFKSGEVNRLRVLKIPKTEISSDSICTLINKSKRDVDLAEVHVSNRIQHPNVAEVVDNFKLNGKTVNAEAYYEGEDLEARIQSTGPITDEGRFNDIFTQVISAVDYLNNTEGILHRDIKPSNIIVTRNGIKLSDLQNAARKQDINELSMPTRGGTPYTHPSLLNALISGSPNMATNRTEVYALGGTMLYALTGKNPFSYHISSDEGGKPIRIGDEIYKIRLDSNGTILEEISEKVHEANLKTALKDVPKKYKDLVYRCLTLNDKKAFRNVSELERIFERTSSQFGKKFKDAVVKGVKIALPAVVVGGLAYATIVGGIKASKEEPRPTFRQVLSDRHYRNFSLEELDGDDYLRAMDVLRPYMEIAKKELGGIEERLEGKDWEVKDFARFAENVHGIPKRVTASWLRACYLNPDFEKRYEREGQERFKGSYVPENFVIRNSETRRVGVGYYDERTMIAQGIIYLKQCFNSEGDVTDLFTNYFSSLENINTARVRAKSIDYFPKEDYLEKDGVKPTYSVQKGYNIYLPYHEQELVNTALALYMITDEEGKTDFSKIPASSMFPAGFVGI